MKFLIFNTVVAAALFYLFAAETTDFKQLAKKAETKISQLQGEVTEVLNDKASIMPKQENAEREQVPIEKRAATTKLQPQTNESLAKSAPNKKTELVPENSQTGEIRTSDKEVMKRRKEVLSTKAVSPASSDDHKFMAPKTRKRELMYLAEEMEILAAKLANK